MAHPFFSIIIPTYNREKFLLKTIKSFIDQTFSDFEIIIIDDGGNDNSKAVVESFMDNRIQYYWKQNGERGAARNYGAAKAKGQYFNFFDSDDIAYPNHLQNGFDVLKTGNQSLMFLGYEFADEQGNILSTINDFKGDVLNDIINRNKRNLNSVFISNEAFNEIKFYENKLMAASEDTLLLIRLVARHKPVSVNIVTSAMIEHNNRSMVTASEEQLLNRKKHLLENLRKDTIFMEKYSKSLLNINAEMDYLLSLSAYQSRDKRKAVKYFMQYITDPSTTIFEKRTLVFLRKLVS